MKKSTLSRTMSLYLEVLWRLVKITGHRSRWRTSKKSWKRNCPRGMSMKTKKISRTTSPSSHRMRRTRQALSKGARWLVRRISQSSMSTVRCMKSKRTDWWRIRQSLFYIRPTKVLLTISMRQMQSFLIANIRPALASRTSWHWSHLLLVARTLRILTKFLVPILAALMGSEIDRSVVKQRLAKSPVGSAPLILVM